MHVRETARDVIRYHTEGQACWGCQLAATVRRPQRSPRFSLAIISVTVQLWIYVFWVISVYFNIRNTLLKFFTFLPGHPVYLHQYKRLPSNRTQSSIVTNRKILQIQELPARRGDKGSNTKHSCQWCILVCLKYFCFDFRINEKYQNTNLSHLK
jgi:hypothetical protein